MTRFPARRLGIVPRRVPGARGVLAAILVDGAGGNAPARPACAGHEAVEIR